MKRLIPAGIALLLLVPALTIAQTRYTIKGKVPKSHPATIAVMSYPPDLGMEYASDTARIRNGKFEFRGSIGRPQLAELNLIIPRPAGSAGRGNRSSEDDNMKNVGLFYLDGRINVTFDDDGMASYSGGGKEQQGWRDYYHMIVERQNSGDFEGMELFESVISDFVKTHPDLYASIDLMDLFTSGQINPGLVGPMYDALSERMQNTPKVLAWKPKLDEAVRLESGEVEATDFTLPDTDGKPVSLSSFKGKYVLLDFWASWCVPCRAEHPHLVAAYTKFKDRNFDILAVSLDDNREAWLKAIEEDGLPWTQVSDLKGAQSAAGKLYGVTSIPQNYLIDPDGKIIAQNLRGTALEKKLTELFGPAKPKEYSFTEFSQLVNVEDQEAYYNEMRRQQGEDDPAAYGNYRAELAYSWLAQGNVERFNQYHDAHLQYSAGQFLYLCDALEKLADDMQYAVVEEITREILDALEKGTMRDPLMRTQVLLELNAVSNAKLGNIELAKERLAKSSEVEDSRAIPYFRDSKANYLHRKAIILSASGDHKGAFDVLTDAFRQAESKPLMVETFREIYAKHKGSEKGFDAYVQALQQEAYQHYYAEVEKKYLAEGKKTLDGMFTPPGGDGEQMLLFRAARPVDSISLVNLEGDSVALGDHLGGILVLDFWTTLCTPCVAAFAGFERVVADYENEPFKLFVVDLFEDETTVKSYAAKKGIMLDILRDEPNAAFDIRGTPTKIVFDPMGNIRFFDVGYAGSTDREYYKLKAMVEITKKRPLEEGSAEDLFTLFQHYGQNSEKKNEIFRTLQQRFPSHEMTRMLRPTLFLHVPMGEEQDELLQSLMNENPTIDFDLEKLLVASGYVELSNTDKAFSIVNTIKDPTFRLRGLVEMMKVVASYDQEQALRFATRDVKKFEVVKDVTERTGSMNLVPAEIYRDFATMYSKLLFQADRYEDSYRYAKAAYSDGQSGDPELVVNHAYLASRLEQKYEEALPVLSKAIREGKNYERFIDEARKGYAALNPGSDVDAYIDELQSEFRTRIRDEVAKLLIDEPAPDFWVTDVNGRKVSLGDFSGKTIVLDFWATWCGPCIASFPAMQMAVNRYLDDPEVEFLFIHCWENSDDPLTDATNFLTKFDYNFDLYMDPRDPETRRSPAADLFEVNGIPAKFVIDGNGRIRFQGAGFSGSKEEAAEELVQMIELARHGA